jgi:PAS domain S-box-containing protein/diguanylate cyclase (GGDEF)-like protein/putative nucleotidyltransferase with HDIG domain
MDASNLHLLLDNAALLIASTIFYQVSTYIKETYDQSSEVFDAFLFGIIGILIMSFPLVPSPGLYIDTRSILVGLIAYIFGGKTSYFLMISLILYRLILGGDGAFIGIVIIVSSGLLGFLFRFIDTKYFRIYSALNFYILGIVIHVIMTFCIMYMSNTDYAVAFTNSVIPLLVIFPITTVVVGKLFIIQREQINQLQLTRFAEKRFRSLFEQAQIGICYLDTNGFFINTNDYFNQMFQYSSDELKLLNIRDLNDNTEFNQNYALTQLLKDENAVDHTVEKPLMRKDGTSFWSNVSVSRIRFNQEDIYMSTVIDISERKKAEEMMHYLNYHDQTTGLNNRHYYEMNVSKYDTEENYPLTLIKIDINGMKLFNDAFGYEMGDTLVKRVVSLIKPIVYNADMFCRFGGSDFIILYTKVQKPYIDIIMAQINHMMTNETIQNIKVSVSSAYAMKNSIDEDLNSVLKKAEMRLSREKLIDTSSMLSRTIEIIMNSLYEKNSREMEHSKRVSYWCEKIAQRMNLDSHIVSKLRIAGLMHDIGKIGIPDSILDKPDRLTEEEFNLIRKHSEVGYRILSAANEFSEIADYILAHHERWDGMGYPKGLKGNDIPIYARIISVADSFDAMTSDRAYRKAMSINQAKQEITKFSNIQFDPSVVKIFLEIIEQDNPQTNKLN